MRLLCTQPLDPALSALPGTGMADYLTTLEELLTRARSEVDVVCPFIDGTGVDVLAGAFDRSGGGARWRVFVRRAEERLLTSARARRWGVYEYVGTPGVDERRGFHCKVFLADQARAIVGSANLLYYNLVENVEIGILLEGPEEVGPLLQVPRALLRASRDALSAGPAHNPPKQRTVEP